MADPSSSQTASKLRHLLDETADLIDSPSFSFVLTLLNNEGFSTLVDQKCANEAFKTSATVPETAPQSFDSIATVIPPSSERKTKLANLLAVMARQAHVIGNGSHQPNEYLAPMEQNVRELEAFSAVIYSSNFDLELLGTSRKDVPAEAEDSTQVDLDSSSFAPVMVDKEIDTEEISQSVPVLVDNEELETELISPAAPQQTQESSAEAGAESAFESAWGKATDGDQPAAETEARS